MKRLTKRQKEIVKRIASGQTMKEIALEDGLSRKTIEYHWDLARKRLGLYDVARVTQWALKNHLIEFSV